MALFGGQRDMSLFNKVNKELINDIIDTEIYYYLRDTLVDKNLVPEVGDVIQWNGEYHLIDAQYSYQYVAGKNPDTWDGGDSQGLNVSIICDAHVTRQSSIKLVDTYTGNSRQNDNEVPLGL